MDIDQLSDSNLSYLSFRSREDVLVQVQAEGELYGQHNRSTETRPNVTQIDFFGGSIICTMDHVTYGTFNGKRACLIVFRFNIRYESNSKPITQADVRLKFRPLSTKSFRSTSGAGQEPIVKVVSPGKLLGTPDESGLSWQWTISKLCNGFGLGENTLATSLSPIVNLQQTSRRLQVKGEPWKSLRERECDMACLSLAEKSHEAMGIPDEFKLATIVECTDHFEAVVDVVVDISWLRKLRAFPFPGDDPVLFIEGPENTPIGNTLTTTNFELLSGEQWLELIVSNNLNRTSNQPGNAGDAAIAAKLIPRAKSEHFTCRVQGIPIHIERSKVGEFLAEVVQMEVTDIKVRSFARDPRSKNEMAATVTSQELSKVLGTKERCTFKPPPQNNIDILIDVRFEDFTVLSDPGEEANVDIIALSGLGSHSFGSFKDRGGKHMWLADRLPFEFAKARIMIYGYDTSLVNSRSFQDLESIANTMCSALKTVRPGKDSQHRPIIFIAHSLGGLVLKELLLQMISSDDARDHVNVNATRGLFMFGVPNLGMNIDSLRGKVKDQPNEPFLQALRPDSESLRRLNRMFKEQFTLTSCKIISFYETMQSPTARKAPDGSWKMDGQPAVMVSQDSATGGSRHWESGADYEKPIQKIHGDLVKFYPRDPCYFIVKYQLDELLRLHNLI